MYIYIYDCAIFFPIDFKGWLGALHESGQSSCLSAPCYNTARNWPVLHGMVLCVSSQQPISPFCLYVTLLTYHATVFCRHFSLTLASPSYEVTSNKFSRSLVKELLVSLWSAVFLGFGTLFLLLWVGIYV